MNILSTCPEYIPSVVLCGDVQLNYLKSSNKLDYRFKRIRDISIDDLIWLDVLYVIRGDSSYTLDIVKWCKRHKKIVIYVLDDNLLEIPSNLSASAFYAKKTTKKCINKLIKKSGGFISPSSKLIEKYSLKSHKVLQIIEPALNKIDKKEQNDIIKIGFAGSIDHGNDIDIMLSDVLKEIKRKYNDKIIIEFFGPKTKLSQELGIIEHPFLDSYDKYQEKMKEYNWDIGLAPLPNSYFNSFKHYNKLIEYESYGIVGVYSNVYPFKFALKDGVNGLIVNNDTKSWVDAISKLIEDDNLRNEISKNCIEQANTIYSLERSSNELYDYLKQFKLPDNKKIHRLFVKISNSWWKVKYGFSRVKSSGIKAPIVIIKKVLKIK